MQPTMKLRILLKEVYTPESALSGYAPKMYKDTLQQWWEQPPLTPLGIPQPTGEWRDVPIEVE